MKYLLLLLLSSSALAAPLAGTQDFQPSISISSAVAIGTTTLPTTALTVYGIVTSSSPVPSATCNAGTATIGANSGNQSGSLLAGTLAVNCTVTFKTPWPKAPVCICNVSTPLAISA